MTAQAGFCKRRQNKEFADWHIGCEMSLKDGIKFYENCNRI